MPVIAYNSPGVAVSESVNPALAPLLANPSLICIVATTASGAQSATERLILSGTTPITLAHTGVLTPSLVVNLASTGVVIDHGNYTIAEVSDPNPNITGDESYSITRVPSPSVAPTVANSGTGTLNGTYVYAYSFVNANGETGISPASSQVTLSNQGAVLTGIAVGGGTTSARNIYRAKVVGGVVGTFNLVATIGNNTVTNLNPETTSDGSAAANPQPKTGIADGDTVLVSYNYADNNYYMPTTFDNFNDVVDKYGNPYDANGNINSQLSYAAKLAFLNGASNLVLVATKSSSNSDFGSAFDLLKDVTSIRMISVISGDPSVHSTLAAHIDAMNTAGNYRFGLIGQDSSTAAIAATTLRASSQAFNDQGVIMISPASFRVLNPVTLKEIAIGSQYMTAAVAGMFSARDVQIPLTRKVVAGFTNANEARTQADLALDSAAGLFVVEPKGSILRVRHGITTAVGDVNTREASVVRAKFEMAHQLSDALDTSVIGLTVPASQASSYVASAVQGILEQLKQQNVIDSYQNLTARQLASSPTTIEVRFEYAPIYPINNINVVFTINTQTGDFALTV